MRISDDLDINIVACHCRGKQKEGFPKSGGASLVLIILVSGDMHEHDASLTHKPQ